MLLIILFSLLIFSCDTPQNYTVTGVIKKIDNQQNRVLINHDEIPGFMTKMVMFFNVHESEQLDSFSVDDSVSFNLIIKENNSYTINYKRLGISKINTFDQEFWDDDVDNKYSLKTPGEFIHDSSFLNLVGDEVKLSEIISDFTLITFIFSKCPMPNMCPASIVKNQFLSNNFKNDNINFIIISFDYLYDTPRVLKNVYGAIENENIIFLSSYGHLNDIISLTKQAGVGFWGVEENNIGHNMRSILVDKDLKLLKSYDGTDWRPGDAKNDIKNLLKIYR